MTPSDEIARTPAFFDSLLQLDYSVIQYLCIFAQSIGRNEPEDESID